MDFYTFEQQVKNGKLTEGCRVQTSEGEYLVHEVVLEGVEMNPDAKWYDDVLAIFWSAEEQGLSGILVFDEDLLPLFIEYGCIEQITHFLSQENGQ